MALSAAERKPQGMPPCRGLDAGIVYAMAMVNRVLHSPMCDWMFKCGCKTLWNGGWSDCNIHNMHGNPRCPWCMPAFDGVSFHLTAYPAEKTQTSWPSRNLAAKPALDLKVSGTDDASVRDFPE
eukprot:TRINITY_DN31062_c0_g1_i2.p1 TRINITY_DN31062_c0_g1~~TRINITY_DN31062_c0_g1_i2.p1  ORF type:complete len:124 (-),score=9.35 TRINITY_DN31062_c0_g1_i2:476-847(-)